MQTSSYEGRERRRHRMFVTRNTEYHFRDRTCVAVRDRRSGTWLSSHLALSRTLCGAVRYMNGTVLPMPSEPSVGEALYFASDGRELVTSLLCAIERPQKGHIAAYLPVDGDSEATTSEW